MADANANGAAADLPPRAEGRARGMHMCTYPGCTKGFSKKYNLKAHLRLHTGATPFECPRAGCDKKFKWRSSLSSHSVWHTRQEACESSCGSAAHAGPKLASERKIAGKATPRRAAVSKQKPARAPPKRFRAAGEKVSGQAAVRGGPVSAKGAGANGASKQADNLSVEKAVDSTSTGARKVQRRQPRAFPEQPSTQSCHARLPAIQQPSPVQHTPAHAAYRGPQYTAQPGHFPPLHQQNCQVVCEYPNQVGLHQASPSLHQRQSSEVSLVDMGARGRSSPASSATTSLASSDLLPTPERSLKRRGPDSPEECVPHSKTQRLMPSVSTGFLGGQGDSGRPGSPMTSVDDSSVFDLGILLGDRTSQPMYSESDCIATGAASCAFAGPPNEFSTSPAIAELQPLQSLSCLDSFELDGIALDGLGL